MRELSPIYIPEYLARDVADAEFARLWENLAWERRPDAPRREYWQNIFGLPYTYGRGTGARTYECKPWDDFIRATMDRINIEFGFGLNCCFVNGYDDERDALGWHADDSPEMSHDEPVLSLSLGAARLISTRHLETRQIERFTLGHGSLFIMPPGFQKTHEHKIPKGDRPMGPRISLTYRGMIA